MDTAFLTCGITRVLLVEDDEDDYIITRELFREISSERFQLDWVRTYQEGLAAMAANAHDVVLVDYRLGACNGIELLRAATAAGCKAPLILLTGAANRTVDMQAMRAGADDYLVKADLQAKTLERSVRYALQRKRAATEAAYEQARLAAFGAEVGLALARRDSLDAILERCCQAMARYLGAALAHICIYDAQKHRFQCRAAAGPICDMNKAGVRNDSAATAREGGMPPGIPDDWTVEPVLSPEPQPVLIPQLETVTWFWAQPWVREHGLSSFAACPLILEDKLVGMMSIYTPHPLGEQILQEMGSVANGIALCVERKRSEEALDASEIKYRSVVDNIKEIIFQLDEFGHWGFLNPAWKTVTGFAVPATLGTFFLDYIHQEDRERDGHIFLQLIQRKIEFCRYETRLRTHDGKIRWVEVYLQRMPAGGTGVSGTITDITDRKQAELQIQKLAAFPKVNPNPVLEFSAEAGLTYANDAARETAAVLGHENLLAILPPNAAEIVQECLRTGAKHLRQEVKLQGRTLVWSFFPVTASQVVHCYGADVTEMLNLEAQFRHAQKLESIGQLAAGVAHDFNNILTVIQGYAETLLPKCRQDPATASGLKQISEAAQRAASLTKQLLMFSRKQVIQPKVLDLNAVLQNVARMLLRLLGEDVALDAVYAPNLPRMEADTGMLEQIVMNLAVNARDAMPRGGKLMIRSQSVHIDEVYAAQRPEARPGNFVRLTVEDTGTGMDRDTLERIFEPFFSTKEVGKGTGLGLATVYGIVKQHQGWIEVSSQVGIGTRFDIYFPACMSQTVEHTAGVQPATTVCGGHETILVVEDEPMLRELVREVLLEYNYKVAEAACGSDALRLWDEFNGEIDLLLTDMVMPEGMSGTELAAQLRQRDPGLKVIYTSGYSAEMMGSDVSQRGACFLPKPYFPPQLAQLVRSVLDAPAHGDAGPAPEAKELEAAEACLPRG